MGNAWPPQLGQQIEIAVGPLAAMWYGTPEVSPPAIRLECIAMDVPPNPPPPAGVASIYIFEAVSEGDAEIKFPVLGPADPDMIKRLTFTVTIHVEPGAGGAPAHASLKADQENTAPWTQGWTDFHGKQQTFTPSLLRLTAVEVELVVANPGPPDDKVTMMVRNDAGVLLASVSKTVPVAEWLTFCSFSPRAVCEFRPDRFTTSY